MHQRMPFILGVKELPEGDSDLVHRHIYFGHVFKDQPGWQHTLGRFVSGEGTLFDLENLVDETGRRVSPRLVTGRVMLVLQQLS